MGLAAPFTGGAVGMFAYDLVRTMEPLGDPGPDPIGLPDLALMLSDVLVIFDHLKHTVTLLTNVYPEEGELEASYRQALQTLADVRSRLAGPVPAGRPQVPAARRPAPFRSNMSRERFEANVARIIEYIRAGDAYQVVPSQRWSAEVPVEGFSIYRGLRAVNPSPYMYFLDFGDFEIAGASPEPLITVHGRRVTTRPVAGTRPRGGNPEEDRRMAEELLSDPKERAEHVMLVDLGRNDLGRVCEYGTVTVDELMAVENYSHVMHIVSNVTGRLRPGVTALDALRSVLPAGTLSGAPKVRAMQIIDELEPVKRGGYGGAIGWVSYTGDLDTCIHIRTVVIKDGQAHVQAGGGTVADAVPEREFEESVAKAQAVMAAIELAVRQTACRAAATGGGGVSFGRRPLDGCENPFPGQPRRARAGPPGRSGRRPAAPTPPSGDPFYKPPRPFAPIGRGDPPLAQGHAVAVQRAGLHDRLPAPVPHHERDRRADRHGHDAAAPVRPRVRTAQAALLPDGRGQPDDHCAPSYTMRGGNNGGSTQWAESQEVTDGLAHGWDVVVPDYQGPRSEWAVGALEGRTTLDSIRAVEHFAPAHLDGSADAGGDDRLLGRLDPDAVGQRAGPALRARA